MISLVLSGSFCHNKAMVRMEHRVREVNHQLLQQSEYCANMGAACATLLWRVSRRQDSIESILSGVSHSVYRFVILGRPIIPLGIRTILCSLLDMYVAHKVLILSPVGLAQLSDSIRF